MRFRNSCCLCFAGHLIHIIQSSYSCYGTPTLNYRREIFISLKSHILPRTGVSGAVSPFFSLDLRSGSLLLRPARRLAGNWKIRGRASLLVRMARGCPRLDPMLNVRSSRGGSETMAQRSTVHDGDWDHRNPYSEHYRQRKIKSLLY